MKKKKKKKKMRRKGRKFLGKVKPVNYFFLKKELSVKLTNFKRQNLNLFKFNNNDTKTRLLIAVFIGVSIGAFIVYFEKVTARWGITKTNALCQFMFTSWKIFSSLIK